MDKNYIKFVIMYDFCHTFDMMNLACDEAYELAEEIANKYIEFSQANNMELHYQALYDYCTSISFKYIWEEMIRKERENMNRINKIAQFAQKKEQERINKEQEKERQIEEYKAKIRTFKHRIDELLAVGNACMQHGIALEGQAWGGHEGYDTHQFITNSWSHLLGFVAEYDRNTRKYKPFTKLGIHGGGACNYNLETDGSYIDVNGDILYILKRFVEEFGTFESEFYKYVDEVTSK